MKKAIKISLTVIAAIAALYISAAVLLSIFFNPNRYRTEISQKASQILGRTVNIAGNISLHVFPSLRVSVSDISVGNPQEFSALSKTKNFAQVGEAQIKLALFPLLTGHVRLNSLSIENTTLNLITSPTGQKNWVISSNQKSSSSTHFNLPYIKIVNANVHWQDLKNHQQYSLKELNAYFDPFQINHITPFHLRFVLDNHTKTLLRLNLKGSIKTDASLKLFTLRRITLNGKLKSVPISLQGDANIDLNQQTAALNNVSFKLANLSAQLQAQVTHLNTQPAGNGTLTISSFNLRSLLQKLDINIANLKKNALNDASLKLRWELAADRLSLSQLEAKLDDSTLNGSLQVDNLKQPIYNFDLAVNQINLSNILANDTSKSTRSNTNANATSASLLKILKSYHWNGKIHVNRLSYRGQMLSDLQISTQSANNIIRIAPLKANLNKGTLDVSVVANLQNQLPQVSTRVLMNRVYVGPLLKALFESDRLDGILTLRANVTGYGYEQSQYLASLQGDGSMDITQGTLKGVNLIQAISRGLTTLRKQNNQSTQSKQTSFSEISASYKINHGILSNNDLRLTSPTIRVTGKGVVNLPKQTIDYRLLGSFNNLLSFAIPIKLSGSLNDPSVSVDIAQLGKMYLQETIKQNVNIGKNLGNFLKNALPSLP